MSSRTIGPMSAYGIAKANGYTGTEAEFASQIANAAQNAQTASNAAETATQAAQTATQKADSIPASFQELTAAVDTNTKVLTLTEDAAIGFTIADPNYGVRHADGTLYVNSALCATNYIDISHFSKLKYKRIGTTSATPQFGMAFYDADKVYISGLRALASQGTFAYLDEMAEIAVPQNAVYVRFSTLNDTATYGDFALTGNSILQGEIDALSENIDTVQDQIVLATPYTALLNSFLCPDFETVIEGRKYSKAGNSITMRWQVSNNSHTVCFFTGGAFYAQNADAVTDAVPPIEALATINSNLNKVKLAIYVASTYTGSTNSNLNIHYCKVENETVTVIDVVRLTTVRMTQYALYNEIELTIPSGATHFALSYFAAGAGPSATVTLGLKPKDEDLQSQIDTLSAKDTVLQNAVDTLSAKDTELESEIDTLTAGKLESTGDATDRTAEIRAKLTANGYCELGDGEFVVANLEMPAGTELRGQGYATVLKLDTSLTSGAAVIVNTNCTLKDMSIVGADAKITFTSESVAGNRHGIRRSYRRTYNVNISNVRVRYFDGYGLYDVNGGTPVQGKDDTQHGGMNVVNCFFDGCFTCLYIQSASNAFTNCECANGFYGAYTYAHGNVFTNCVFLGNLTDAYVKSNGATFVGCLFKKETSTVEGDALVVIDGARPLKAVGCTFNNCGGIRVATTDSRITACMDLLDGCEFYNMVLPIVCTSGRGILFNGCLFEDDVTASGNIEETTAGAVKLKNCYLSTYGTLLER